MYYWPPATIPDTMPCADTPESVASAATRAAILFTDIFQGSKKKLTWYNVSISSKSTSKQSKNDDFQLQSMKENCKDRMVERV